MKKQKKGDSTIDESNLDIKIFSRRGFLKTTIATTVSLALSACGGGSGDTESDNTQSNPPPINPPPTNPPPIVASSTVSMIMSLTSAGRFSFYIDYSELSSAGTHTFYVMRSHGTVGQCTVDYEAFGDAHTPASGTLTFPAGSMEIQSFTVEVPTKSVDGDHRIYVTLSNPTNGAVLHNGAKTIAYGVIDDDTIALDSDAVFADMDAVTNGIGTNSSPFNNIYDGIAEVNSSGKRYLYLRGTHTIDGTNTKSQGGVFKCIDVPATRTSEATRLYIRSWPGFARPELNGTGQSDVSGFYGFSGESYHTYRKINFKNIDVRGVEGFNGGGMFRTNYGGSTDLTFEYLDCDEMYATTNPASLSPWGVDHWKAWKCTIDNTLANAVKETVGVQHYEGTNGSVQGCLITGCDIGIYPKGIRPQGYVETKMAFNKIDASNGTRCILTGFGSANGFPDFGLIYGNALKNALTFFAIRLYGGSAIQSGKYAIFNNVFDNCGGSGNPAISSNNTYGVQIFNNIFNNCESTWGMRETVVGQNDPSRTALEHGDYNYEYASKGSHRYILHSVSYTTKAALRAVAPEYAEFDNDTFVDPNFVDNSDYELNAGSPCEGNGHDGVDQGIHLTGLEINILGAGAS